MELLPICVALLACLVAKGSCDAIQCYECDNCGNLNDSLLVSCPSDVSTQPPISSSSADTSSSTESNDLSSSTESNDSSSSTVPSSLVSSSTGDPEGSSSSTPSLDASSPSSTTESTKGAKIGGLSATDLSKIASTIQNKSRRSRSVRSDFKAGPSYACYSLDKVDGGDKKVKKGCIEVPEDKSACDVLGAENGTIENCKACNTDKCNSGVALKFSFVTLLLVALIPLINK